MNLRIESNGNHPNSEFALERMDLALHTYVGSAISPLIKNLRRRLSLSLASYKEYPWLTGKFAVLDQV
jgi:hypothetical protein